MIQRILPILVFTAVAICVIQLVNYSFAKTYSSIESSIKKPYAQAQSVYETTANEY